MNMIPKKAIALSLMFLTAFWCARAESEQPEYIEFDGGNDDWAYCPDHVDRSYGDNIYNFRSMDVFYLGPSVVSAKADFCDRGDASDGLKAIWKETAATFAPVANVYVPCFRQLSLEKEKALTNGYSRLVAASNVVSFLRTNTVAYADVVMAMDAYFTNFNPHVGRPFVLIGDGQGAALLQILMEQYFTNAVRRAYLHNLVSCYADGHVVDPSWPTLLANRTGLGFQSLSNLTGSEYKTYAGWVSETGSLNWNALLEDALRRRAALRDDRTLTVDNDYEEDVPDEKFFTSITNAIKYARENNLYGCTINVAPGVYPEYLSFYNDLGYTLVSTQHLGAVIDGEGKHRCAEMGDEIVARARFHGFVFRNGFEEDGYGGGGVYNCDLSCSVVSNCYAKGAGGGVAHGRLNQCLVVRNRSEMAGGGVSYSSFNACTIANNDSGTNTIGGVFNDERNKNNVGLNSIVALNNPSNVAGRIDLGIYRAIRIFADGDPKFVDPEHDDYRLRADSPCVDAGFCDFVHHAVDLAGNPRVLGAEVDYGCYEHLRYAALPPGSLNVSSNAQTVGSVVYAQRPWNLTIEPAAGWLTADVVSGATNTILHFTVAENTTGKRRTGYLYLRDAVANVQTVRVDQVARSDLAAFDNRRGVFVGVTEFERVWDKDKGKFVSWAGDIDGCVQDAVSYRKLWCGLNPDADHAQLFTNSLAKLVAVSNAVETMIDKLGPQDEFMLGFSTHGGPSKGIWEASFSLYPAYQEYPFGLLTNQLKRAAAKCRKVIFVADACHSAALYKFAEQMMVDAEATDTHGLPIFAKTMAMSSRIPQAAPFAGVANIAFIVAADYDETSLAGDARCLHGEFTAGMLRAFLKDSLADTDGDGYLDFHELYRSGRAYSEIMGDPKPDSRWQARCYNKNLLLETRAYQLKAAARPRPYMPVSPYYADFANWMNAKGVTAVTAATRPNDIESEATNNFINVGGRMCPVWEAFVALGDNCTCSEDVTNAPFKVSIAVGTNGMPSITCVPDLAAEVPRRVYTFYGKRDLTNAVWQVVSTNDLKECKFFKAAVSLP